MERRFRKRGITKRLMALVLVYCMIMQTSMSAFAVSTGTGAGEVGDSGKAGVTVTETVPTPTPQPTEAQPVVEPPVVAPPVVPPGNEEEVPPVLDQELQENPGVKAPNNEHPVLPPGLTSIDPNYKPPLEQYLAQYLDSNSAVTTSIDGNGIPKEDMERYSKYVMNNEGSDIDYFTWKARQPQRRSVIGGGSSNPILAFSADTQVLVALKGGGLIAWGDNSFGQAGGPSSVRLVNTPTRVPFFDDKQVVNVMAVNGTSFVVTSDLTTYVMGNSQELSINSNGWLVLSEKTARYSPYRHDYLSNKRVIYMNRPTLSDDVVAAFADNTSGTIKFDKLGYIVPQVNISMAQYSNSLLIGEYGVLMFSPGSSVVRWRESGDDHIGCNFKTGSSYTLFTRAGDYEGWQYQYKIGNKAVFSDNQRGTSVPWGQHDHNPDRVPASFLVDQQNLGVGFSIGSEPANNGLTKNPSAPYSKRGSVRGSGGIGFLYGGPAPAEPRTDLFYTAVGNNEFYGNKTGFRILTNDTVQVAGSNAQGKAGVGTTSSTVGEQVIGALSGKGIQHIESYGETTFFISGDGRVYAAGSNVNGELGQGPSYYMTQSTTPIEVNLNLQPPRSVTVTQSAGGTIMANPTSAKKGATITVSASPSAGYELAAGSLRYNGIPIAGNSFVMPDQNVNVTAQFTRRVHAVSVYATPNGVVSVNRSSAAPGEAVSVTVTPNSGFQLRPGTLKYNSVPMSGSSFSMPDGPTTVSAEFERVPYQVLLTQPANGTIQSSVYSAYPGDTVNLLITPNSGFGLKANTLKMNGIAVAGTSFIMPSGNASITAEFEASAFSIAVHPAPNGSVSVDKPSAKPGEIVTVTASANNGFALGQNGITLNNSPITGTSFTMPMYSVSVTAKFEPVYYNVTIVQTPNGNVTTNKSIAVINEGVMVSAIPSPGYRLRDGGITINGTAISGSSFTMPNNHCTVSAQFDPILFDVVVNNAQEGVITVSKTQAYTGDQVSVEVFPTEGYRVRTGTLRYDNISITTGQFRMPANNTVVTCEYDVIYNDIVILPPNNGILTASKDTALLGDTIVVNAVPDRGYRASQGGVLANGVPISGNSFLMPLAPVTLVTQFQPIMYDITTQDSTRGRIVATKTQGVINELIELSIMPNEGYQVKANSLRVNGVIREEHNFIMPAANVLVTVDFEPIQYPINVPTSVGGLTRTDRQTAKIGDLVKVQTIPETGYSLNDSTLRVNGNPITVKQFVMTPQDTVVEADYNAIDYSARATPSANGHVFLSKSTANINDVITMTIKPEEGYRLVDGSLRMNGMSLTGTTFVMPASDVTVTASFETIQYAINVPSVQNGRISASSTTSTVGSDIRVTVLPNSGYQTKSNSLTVDGVAIKGGEFKMPAKSVQLAIEFEPIVYKATVLTSNNGKLAIDKTSAIMNEKVTITTLPAEGYKLINGSVRVNGVPNYGSTFMMPAEDVLVSADFEPLVYTVKVTQSPNGTTLVDKPNAIIGQDVLITTRPEKGYKVSDASLQVNGDVVKNNTFKMPAKTVEVTVKYERVVYDIDLPVPQNGTASISKLQANYDEEIKVVMKPDPGFEIGSSTLRINGNSVTGDTFRMPDRNSVVTVEFTTVTYNAASAYFNGGRVSFDKPYARVGEDITVVIDPDSGYKFIDGTLRINGQVLTGLKMKMPAKDIKPEARFEPSVVQGTVTDSSSKPVGGIEVVLESAFYSDKVQSSANGGFQFKLVPNGRFKLKTNDYTWTNAATDVEIKDGLVVTTQRPVLIIDRDRSVEEVEAMIAKLPLQTSSMTVVMNASDAIHGAKISYDLLNAEQKQKVNATLQDKLRILFAKVTPIEVEVLSSMDEVTVTDVELSINKEQYITLETSSKDRIMMQVFINPIQEPTLTEEELVKEKINKNESVLSYMDVTVLQKIGTQDPVLIDQLNKPITITVGLQDKETGAKYRVVRVHDDEATILPTTMDASKLTFKTDKFSTYAIVTTAKVGPPTLVDNAETLYWEGVIRKIQNAGSWDVLNEDISAQKVVPTAVIQTINDWTGEMHFVWDVEAFMLTGKNPIQIQEQKMFFTIPELIDLCKRRPVINKPIVEQQVQQGINGIGQPFDYDSIFSKMSTEIETGISKALPNGLFSFMTGNKDMSPLDTMLFVFLFTLFVIVISVTVIFLTPVAKLAGVRLADDFSRKLKKKKKKGNKLTKAGTGRLKNSMSAISSAGESFKEMIISKSRESKPKQRLLERFKGAIRVPEVVPVLSVEDEVKVVEEVVVDANTADKQPIISEEDTPNYEVGVQKPRRTLSNGDIHAESLSDWLEALAEQEVVQQEQQEPQEEKNSDVTTVPPEI